MKTIEELEALEKHIIANAATGARGWDNSKLLTVRHQLAVARNDPLCVQCGARGKRIQVIDDICRRCRLDPTRLPYHWPEKYDAKGKCITPYNPNHPAIIANKAR